MRKLQHKPSTIIKDKNSKLALPKGKLVVPFNISRTIKKMEIRL